MKLRINTFLKLNTALVVSLFGVSGSNVEDNDVDTNSPIGAEIKKTKKRSAEQDATSYSSEENSSNDDTNKRNKSSSDLDSSSFSSLTLRSGSASAKAPSNKAYEYFKAANEFSRQNEYELAIENYAMVQSIPGCSVAYRIMAHTRVGENYLKLKDALRETAQSNKQEKNKEYARKALKSFICALSIENDEGTPILYERDLPNTLSHLLNLSKEVEEYDAVISTYENVLDKHTWADKTQEGLAWYNWGMFFYEKAKIIFSPVDIINICNKKIRIFESVLQKNSEYSINLVKAHYYIGDCYKRIYNHIILKTDNDREVAIKHFFSALDPYTGSLALSDDLRRAAFQDILTLTRDLISNDRKIKAYNKLMPIDLWHDSNQKEITLTSSGTAFYNDNQFEKALDRYTKAAEVDGIINRHKALALYWAGRTAQFLAQISAKTRKEKAITKTQEAGPYEAAIVDVLRRIKESKIPDHFTDGHLQTFLKAHEEEEKIEKYAKQAIKNFCEAAELAKSDDFRQSFENVIPNDLFTLLRLYEQYATYEDVLDAYDKAYEVVQWTNQNQKGVLLHNWGHVYLAKRDFKQAIKKQEEALKLGGYSLANRANTYRSVGFLYNNLLTQSSNDKEANTQNAIDNFCMALELKLGDSTPALCLEVRSETFRYLLGLINNLPQSKNKIAAHERAFSIGEWTNSNQKVFMLIKWANTYLSVGSLELAIEKFQEARKELGCSPYERAFSLFSEAMVDGKIFERSNETNHAKNAINNCAKALDVQNSDGKLALYDGQILDILRKLSVLSAKIKKYDEAITIYEKVLLSHLWANQGEKGVAWQNWGMVYYNMGNFEKAIVKFYIW